MKTLKCTVLVLAIAAFAAVSAGCAASTQQAAVVPAASFGITAKPMENISQDLLKAFRSIGVKPPEDMSILRPVPDVPVEFAKFSSGWRGSLDGPGTGSGFVTVNNVLVVEKVEATGNVVAVYAYRVAANGVRARAFRIKGTITNGELVIVFSIGSRARYRMTNNGTLDGIYTSAEGFTWRGILTRVNM